MKESKKIRKGLMVTLLIAVSISIFLFMGIASVPPLAKVSDDNRDLAFFVDFTQQTADSKYISLDYSAFSDNKASLLPIKKGAAELSDQPSNDWLATVQEDIQKSEYNVTWKEQTHLPDIKAAYQAPNRAHNMRTYFTQEGIRVIPRTSTKSNWTWGLSLKGFGYEESIQPVESSKLSVTGNRIEYMRGNLTEWYINNERGIEQGFTIQSPPESGRQDESKVVLKLDVDGDLNGILNSLGNTIEFNTANGVGAVRYGELHAFDTNGRQLPAKLTLEGKTIDILVDTSDALYPITIDPLATSPSWMAESNQAYADFGWSVSTAGDVNGDGYSDVIVGAPGYDNGESNEGMAFVYYGSASGLSATPNWSAEANEANASFGYSVGTAGDVNGDGYSDVIVGARYFGSLEEGRAFVYYGSASGLSPTANWSTDVGPYAWFGWSVGTAGDVNGDGYSDVIVGAINYDIPSGTGDFEGGAFVYYGSASGLSTTANWTAHSDVAYADFGYSVGTAGDVNGDGYDDVIVGAKTYSNGETSEGAAFVYYGSASGLSTTPNWTAEGNQASAYFGCSVGTAGDVNGDGYDDVIVGAEFYNIKGRAFVYYGSASGLSTTPNWIAETDRNGNFGHSVGTAGDVNGDGYSDVIIGAFKYANGQSQEGAAFVYYGSASGLNTAPGWIGEINQAGAEFGCSVGTAGDVNGDGSSDVIIGAHKYHNGEDFEGGAFVYYGYPSPIISYSPTSFSFTTLQKGNNPPDQTLNITNTGTGTLNWLVSDNAAWLSLSPTSGTNSGTVTLSVDIAGLTEGIYNATITIAATGATNSPVDIPVTLTINVPTSASRWIKTYYKTSEDNDVNSIQQTSDGGYIVAGWTQSLAGVDAWVLKLDVNGNVQWPKTYGGTSSDYASCLQQTSDGGYIVAGSTVSFGAGNGDAWILKLDGNGNVQWQKTYGGTSSDWATSVQQTSDGGYIVAGWTRSFGVSYVDAWVLKLNSDGTIAWQKTYNDSNNYYYAANSVQQTSDGGYVVMGKTAPSGTDHWASWVLKLDGSGSVQWQKTYDSSGYTDEFKSIRQTSDGGYIVAAGIFENWHAWILKLDSNGNVQWQKAGSTYPTSAQSVEQTSDGGYIVAGEIRLAKDYAWVVKLDMNGNVQWQKAYSRSQDESIARSIKQTTDGGYVVTGRTYSFASGFYDSWIFAWKLGVNGETYNCSFMKTPDEQVHDTNVSVLDTDVIETDSYISPQTSTASVSNTTVVMKEQCIYGCNLVPDATSIPRGGTLGFQGTVTNNIESSGSVLFASKVTLPNGNLYPSSGYLFGPLSIYLNPYQSKSKHLSQAIPSNAPTGSYLYHGYVGNYGAGIYDECWFNFEVTK